MICGDFFLMGGGTNKHRRFRRWGWTMCVHLIRIFCSWSVCFSVKVGVDIKGSGGVRDRLATKVCRFVFLFFLLWNLLVFMI